MTTIQERTALLQDSLIFDPDLFISKVNDPLVRKSISTGCFTINYIYAHERTSRIIQNNILHTTGYLTPYLIDDHYAHAGGSTIVRIYVFL